MNRHELLKARIQPITSAPLLRRGNGCGWTLLGTFHDPALGRIYFKRYFFTLFWVPLIPLSVYLVSHPTDQAGKEIGDIYRFHGRLSMKDLREIYGQDFKGLSGSIALEAALGFVVVLVVLFIVGALFSVIRNA